MRKPYHTYDPIFRENFYFMPGFTHGEIVEAVKACCGVVLVGGDLPGEAIAGRMWSIDVAQGGGKFIWVRDVALTPKTIGVLVHECFHASGHMLQDKGYIYCANNDEPAAYHLEWLVTEFARALSQELREEKLDG